MFHLCTRILVSSFIANVWAQSNELAAVRNVSSPLNQFSVRLLSETSDKAGDNINLALSPYTVWSLLSIIAEGAKDNTAQELDKVLGLPSNKESFRRNYKSLTKYLQEKADNVQLDINSAIFASKNQTLIRAYQTLVNNFYGVDIMPTDFKNVMQAVNSINSYVAKSTQNKIVDLIKDVDVVNSEVLMVSTLFFKGRWKLPFNDTATFSDKFYDESGNVKGSVSMMYQIGSYPYSFLANLKSHAVELPYGKGDRMSLIVILPQKGEKLSSVLRQIVTVSFDYVLNTLETAEQQFGEDYVQVYLPRFSINSELNLNEILHQMGIKDVFDPYEANLLGIFHHYLFISRVIQQARIEVNEEGTVASAAAAGSLQNRIPPPKFNANKSFAYFIVDKPTRSILFCGKVTNPNNL